MKPVEISRFTSDRRHAEKNELHIKHRPIAKQMQSVDSACMSKKDNLDDSAQAPK